MQLTSTCFTPTVCFLLVITYLLKGHSAPVPSVRSVPRMTWSTEQEAEYNRLLVALEKHQYQKIYISKFESSSKCPFKVLRVRGYTRMMCDFTECSGQNALRCNDCEQAYLSRADLKRKRRKLTHCTEIEMGCIYNPKQINQAIETKTPGPQVF
jgi:hypothetical protein